jgi:thiol-disulfide isomerase/thioredoxin
VWSKGARRFVLGAALLTAGSAHAGDAPDPEDPAVLKKRLDAAQAEITTLRGQLGALEGRLNLIEQRLGVAPFTPRALQAGGGQRLELGAVSAANVLDSADAAPKKQKLAAALKGRPGGLVAVWATWCKPCTSDEELARLRQMQATLAGEGLAFVSLAIDGLDKVRGDARAPKWIYPVWQADDAHLDVVPKALIDALGVKLPMFFVVTTDGTITHFRTGALDDRSTAELLTAALQLRR